MKCFEVSKRFRALGLGAVLAAVSTAVSATPVPWQLNMTPGVTKTSQEVYQIHMWAFYVCCVIGAIVFGAMIIAMVKFRKSKGAVPATWSHSTKLELVWTTVPILILVGLAAPATNVMISMAHTENSQMTVKITGYQWKWRYEYLNWGDKPYHVNFISKLDRNSDLTRQLHSGLDPWAIKAADGEQTYLLNVDHPLVLPTDTKVRFVITGDDVIHSWWVPAARLEAGCDPRHRQRRLDQDPRAGHLPRPVRGTVRPGSRLHADRRQGGAQGRVPEVARPAGSGDHAAVGRGSDRRRHAAACARDGSGRCTQGLI